MENKFDKTIIDEALERFGEYKRAKEPLIARILENERWWKLRQWEAMGETQGREDDPEPTSAWLFNSIINKHADAMDNFPAPNFLAREQSDEETAKKLQKIIPTILEYNDFEQTYSDCWWYKLKNGTSVTGVFWNKHKENGLGDVEVRKIDLLDIYWEAGISDIQNSKDVFVTAVVDKEALYARYPELEGQLQGGLPSSYVTYTDKEVNDSELNNDRVIVYDWYYKKQMGEQTVVHLCKFVEGHVLYATEEDPEWADRGLYDHGKYPFVFDTLFPIEGSIVGFGYVDVMKSPQQYIDKLDQLIIKNCAQVGTPRYFVRESAGVDMETFADWQNPFVPVSGMPDDNSLRQIETKTIPAYVYNHRLSKIDELKETSGNRDFSQGSTQAGVTAASAIAALQEAGSKLSRDMIKTSYRAHRAIVELVFENVRQFYDEQRSFRITAPNGSHEYMSFSNAEVKPQQYGLTEEDISRLPVFDIKIRSQKQSPFSREAQNENAKEMYRMGAFNPQNATQSLALLEMMDFEGIDEMKTIIKENDAVMKATMELIQLSMAMAQTVDNMVMREGAMSPDGTPPQSLIPQIAQLAQAITGQEMMPQQTASEPKDDGVDARVTKARMKAREGSRVQ